jgi:opacity protein-like surface antigen
LRTIFAMCFVCLFALSVSAEDNSASIQNSIGYANLSFPDLTTGSPSHHSGFVNQTTFNLSRTWGLDNYMGVYSLGQGSTLLADFFGGKVMHPVGKVVPYGLIGLGGGYFSLASSGSVSAFAMRYGGGVSVPISDSLAWKVEYSRMKFHVPTSANSSWTASNNLSAGIVFTISN